MYLGLNNLGLNGRRNRFSPSFLFTGGAQGFWYDPSDLSTQFQDSAGTTPVTAVGQPVGKVLDKSGRGNHLIQATAAARPVLQQDANGFLYWATDGVDDCWATAATVNFSTTDKLSVFTGIRKESDAAAALLVELTVSTAANDGGFFIAAPSVAAANFAFSTRGTVASATDVIAGFPAPVSAVLSCVYDNAGSGTGASAQIRPRINGVAQVNVSGTTAGNHANATLFVAKRAAGLPFTGRIYQLFGVAGIVGASDIVLAERFVGSRMGIML